MEVAEVHIELADEIAAPVREGSRLRAFVRILLVGSFPDGEGHDPTTFSTSSSDSEGDKETEELLKIAIDDIKVIQGVNGLFVSMPSRRIRNRCSSCQQVNCREASYCNWCGGRLPDRGGEPDERRYVDVAYPVTRETRAYLSRVILEAYHERMDHYQGEYQQGEKSPDSEEDVPKKD